MVSNKQPDNAWSFLTFVSNLRTKTERLVHRIRQQLEQTQIPREYFERSVIGQAHLGGFLSVKDAKPRKAVDSLVQIHGVAVREIRLDVLDFAIWIEKVSCRRQDQR